MDARRRASLVLAASLLGFGGCAAPPARPPFVERPRFAPLRPFEPGRPAIALVLSGGSARGFAHIGVIRVLEEIGLEPDLIVGASSGSIVGAAYAAGLDAEQLAVAAEQIEPGVFADFTLPNLGQPWLRGELGLVRGARLQAYVDALVGGRNLEALPRRFAVVATDLQSGEPTIFTHGSTALAVRASAAVPGIFVPPSIGGRLYTDGQISSPVPVTAARRLGAEIVIAVDATFPPEHMELTNTANVLFQSFMIATRRIKDYELGLATLVIRPEIRSARQLGLKDREWIVAAGERAARDALPQLLALRRAPLRPLPAASDGQP